MSIINEALKKAQRQRGGDDLPGTVRPAASALAPARNPQRAPKPQRTLLLWTGAVTLIVLSAVVTVFLVRNAPAPVSAKAGAIERVPEPAAEAPAEPAAIAAASLAPPPADVPASSAPAITLATTAGQSLVASETSASSSPLLPVIQSAPTEEIPAVTVTPNTVPPEMVARIYAFIDNVQVTGIRASGSESKVILNGRVYRLNDLVERLLGLRLMSVESDRLTFSDPTGAIYTKNF